MGRIHVKATAMLAARPVDVYATIADYRHGHPNILPKQYLYDLRVEEGGYGAGTVIRFKSRFLGVERSFHHRISEPEPGSVLIEQDVDDVPQETTTFTVLPMAQGQQSHVEIATTMTSSPGLRGIIERLLIPMALAPVYRQELRLLEAVARQHGMTIDRLPQH